MRYLFIIYIFLYLVLTNISAAQSVWLFEHENYGGYFDIFEGSTTNIGPSLNDKVSSLYVPNGYLVILYEHENYGGKAKIFTKDTPKVGSNFNDITSSFRVVGLSDTVGIYVVAAEGSRVYIDGIYKGTTSGNGCGKTSRLIILGVSYGAHLFKASRGSNPNCFWATCPKYEGRIIKMITSPGQTVTISQRCS
jgi:hypothetical protein